MYNFGCHPNQAHAPSCCNSSELWPSSLPCVLEDTLYDGPDYGFEQVFACGGGVEKCEVCDLRAEG